MFKFSPFLALAAVSLLLTGCGGSDLMDRGHLSVELLGNGDITVQGEQIDCPDTCERDVVFTPIELRSLITITRRVPLSATVGSDATFLGWLVDDRFSTNYEETCRDGLDCELQFKTLCGVGNYFPPTCAANGINTIQLRPITIQTDALIDWDRESGTLCALTEPGQAQCWESRPDQYRDFERTTPPSLIQPTQISAASGHACVLDQTGVHCWSDDMEYITAEPSVVYGLSQVESVVVSGSTYACALADGALTCWRRQALEVTPAVTAPENLRRRSTYTLCVDDGPETVCWDTRVNSYEEWREPRS